MKTETIQMNIPRQSISTIVDRLSTLYLGAIENKIPFKSLPTPFLWGAAGVGKSEGVYQLAENIQKKTGKTTKVTDVRLLLFSPVDLRGVPVADAEKRFTNWLMPKIFDMSDDDSAVNILFLDELSAAPQSVQAAAYQISLDRKIGEFDLPSNCIVIAAGNRTTDLSVAYKMPKALCNRLMHFNVSSSYDEWRVWAQKSGISDKIIAYLAFDNSRLCVEPEGSDLAYCTPRSWAFVSKVLQACGEEPENVHDLIAACVGNDTALEFESFCKGYISLPPVKEIIRGRCKELPKTHDVMYALVSSLTSLMIEKGNEMTIDELNNVCDYVLKLPRDFCMSFMKDVNRIPEMNLKLMKCNSFQGWFNKNKRFL